MTRDTIFGLSKYLGASLWMILNLEILRAHVRSYCNRTDSYEVYEGRYDSKYSLGLEIIAFISLMNGKEADLEVLHMRSIASLHENVVRLCVLTVFFVISEGMRALLQVAVDIIVERIAQASTIFRKNRIFGRFCRVVSSSTKTA